MKNRIKLVDKKFPLYWMHYVLQSIYATLAVSIVLLVLKLQNAVVVASIVASAFIIFSMPNSISANPRNVLGGHMIGLICGSLFGLIPHPSFLIFNIVYTLAVEITFFLMVTTDTEHPPAAGTALGIALTGFSPDVALALVTSVIILAAIHFFFKPYLNDLVYGRIL